LVAASESREAMNRVLLLLLVFAFSARPLLSADELLIVPGDGLSHIGERVSVSGLVVAVFVSKRGNVFLNFGDKYPNQTFTGWVPAGTPLASDPSLQLLQGKTVKITGVIELYHGKPEIRITSKDQIVSE
jgi:DNA/RNA endonuclease YhcR with UshA esterase domain